eukprot:Gb_08573 [translate_table: standard]
MLWEYHSKKGYGVGGWGFREERGEREGLIGEGQERIGLALGGGRMGMEAVGSVSLSHCDENGNEQRNLPFEKQSESEEEEKKCECWETNTLASPIHVQVAPSADSIVYDEHQEQPPPSHHHKGKLPKKRKLKAVTEAAGPVFQGSDHNVQKITTLTTSVKDGGMKCCSDSASSDANKESMRPPECSLTGMMGSVLGSKTSGRQLASHCKIKLLEFGHREGNIGRRVNNEIPGSLDRLQHCCLPCISPNMRRFALEGEGLSTGLTSHFSAN